jgi:hypothetical protein
MRVKFLLPIDVPAQRSHPGLGRGEIVGLYALLFPQPQVVKRQLLRYLAGLGVEAELVHVELQRIGWDQTAVRKFVVNEFVSLGRVVYSIEPTGQEKGTDVELECFFQQIGRRELSAVGLPVSGEERPTLLVLALGQRPSGVVVAAFEMGEECIKGDRYRQE